MLLTSLTGHGFFVGTGFFVVLALVVLVVRPRAGGPGRLVEVARVAMVTI
jgi:hypothetical protein